MTKSLVLAIDQGGQSSRVAVYTLNGEQLHCFSAPCATSHKRVSEFEYIEQDPVVILSGIKNCIEKIHHVLGDDTKHITAAGFAGQGSSLLCWDTKTGEALSPVLSWQDVRGHLFLESIPLANEQARELTGLRVSPHYGASKMRWCLDNNCQAQDALKNNSLSISPIVSYIFWHLTGKSCVDPGHAQRTLLWNLKSSNWDEQLLGLFKIPRNILPECKSHNGNFGNLRLSAYQIPFKASARDQGASLFCRGLPDQSVCYVNIGTGAFIQRVASTLDAPEGLLVSPLWLPENDSHETIELSSPTCYAAELADDFKLPHLLNTREKSLYAWEATANGAASAIAFMQEQTGLKITPDDINNALNIEPAHDCFFLNAIGGLGAPYWRTDLASVFSDILVPHEKILAWLESIIFQVSVNVDLMNQMGSAQKIYISGGFSNANVLCQKIADVTQIPVHRSENADATLQGIACMAACIPASWKSDLKEDIFKPCLNLHLRSRFEHWKQLMEAWLAP
ncbi:MAG: glycerol kinase [Gammaproteobacteria bacterium]|nr:MAG: glycerol kinase [Gammaproteobacteria bacterium]